MTRVCVTTSWDDGHPLDFRVADLLEKYGLKGTFYVPKRAATEVMSESCMRELSHSFEVGAHSLGHVYLDTVPMREAVREIEGSKQWVESVTGKNCPIFCFPGGAFLRAHLDVLRESGFAAVRTVELLDLEGPRRLAGLWEIPTTMQVFPHPRASYIKNSAKRRTLPRLSATLAILRSGDWKELANELLQRVAQTRGVFHLWGHSWEIESHGLWAELEELLAMMSNLTSQTDRLTNMELCSVYESRF